MPLVEVGSAIVLAANFVDHVIALLAVPVIHISISSPSLVGSVKFVDILVMSTPCAVRVYRSVVVASIVGVALDAAVPVLF